MPAVVMKVVLALGDMPPDGILAYRLQADRTGLFFLRGRAKLLPHAAKSVRSFGEKVGERL